MRDGQLPGSERNATRQEAISTSADRQTADDCLSKGFKWTEARVRQLLWLFRWKRRRVEGRGVEVASCRCRGSEGDLPDRKGMLADVCMYGQVQVSKLRPVGEAVTPSQASSSTDKRTSAASDAAVMALVQ